MPRRPSQVIIKALDAEGHYRLTCDDIQWIVEKRNTKQPKPGRESGYRGVSYPRSRRERLLEDFREKGIELTPEAERILLGLPETFREFRRDLDHLGIDTLIEKASGVPANDFCDTETAETASDSVDADGGGIKTEMATVFLISWPEAA